MTRIRQGLRVFNYIAVHVCTCQYKMFRVIIFMGHSVYTKLGIQFVVSFNTVS